MSNYEWLNKELTFAINHYKELVRKNRFHPVLGNPKKIIRGLRRQRNWLMQQGQWPMNHKLKQLGIMTPSDHEKMLESQGKISFVPNFDLNTRPTSLESFVTSMPEEKQ